MKTTKNDTIIATSSWFVYMLRCADNSLYTGITTNISRRVDEHNGSHKGARYTQSRRPVALVYSENQRNRSSASQRECAIKKLTRLEKERLIKPFQNAS